MALFGHIDERDVYGGGLLASQAFSGIFHWLAQQNDGLPVGDHQIGKTGIMAVCMEEKPVRPRITTLEAHIRMIDIHYCLAGGETIQVVCTGDLTIDAPYVEAKDVTMYKPPSGIRTSEIMMRPGIWAVLMPHDAHLPFCDSGLPSVKKIVVKLPISSI